MRRSEEIVGVDPDDESFVASNDASCRGCRGRFVDGVGVYVLDLVDVVDEKTLSLLVTEDVVRWPVAAPSTISSTSAIFVSCLVPPLETAST